jgi:hypothetical protein
MTEPSPPSRKKLILQPLSPAEVSYGAGLGQIISEEEGRERLARYVTERSGSKPGEGEGRASDSQAPRLFHGSE